MNPMWTKQVIAVLRLELKKSFFAKRGLWIYLLALIPLLIWGGHAIERQYKRERLRRDVTPGVTRDMMMSVKRGMTMEQVRAILPESQHQSSRRLRGRDAGELAFWTYSDGTTSINIMFRDGTVRRINTEGGTCDLAEDTTIFAGIFQFFYMRLAIFFGCMFVFMNLFRGEMPDRSLHYYFLAPIRRDVLVAGKFLAGFVATTIIFGVSTAAQWGLFVYHFDSQTAAEYLSHSGWAHLFAYLGVTALACLGYGSVFLAAGILIRNPLTTATVVLLWESINGILPAALRKISVIYYLKSLCPVEIPMSQGVPPPLVLLASNVDGATPLVATLGLLALSAVVIYVAATRIKRLEINYSTDS